MFCCVRGYGGRQPRRTMVSPTHWTPFPFRPMHSWLVRCWPARVWSVYRHVVAAAVVLMVHGRFGRLMVGLFCVGSLALQRASARSDVVRIVAMLVSVLVGSSCVGPALYILTVRHPLTLGEKSNDKWSDRCEKFPNLVLHSLSRPGSVTCTTHHPVFRSAPRPSFQLRQCHSYAQPPRWQGPVGPPGASPCSPWEPQGAALAWWCGARIRVCLPVVCLILPCLAGYVAGVSVSQCGARRLGLLGSCYGVGTLCPVWRAGSGMTHPCSLAGAGGFTGRVWRAFGPLRAPGGGPEERNTGHCRSPPWLIDAVNFPTAGNVSLIPFLQVLCAESAPAS